MALALNSQNVIVCGLGIKQLLSSKYWQTDVSVVFASQFAAFYFSLFMSRLKEPHMERLLKSVSTSS
jgi:hypothetical protein